MKNLLTTLLSLFGFGNKKTETAIQEPKSDIHPNKVGYWEGSGLANTITLRQQLINHTTDKNEQKPTKCDIESIGTFDLSIDNNLILPFRTQTERVQQLLLWNTIISNNEARKAGLTRLPKIVSELRKKAWSIKTYIIFKNGKKQDVIYVLMDNSDEMLGAETYVVK